MVSDTVPSLGRALEGVCQALCAAEAALNDLDRESGDGDCGSTHSRGAQGEKTHIAVLQNLCLEPVRHVKRLIS